MDEAPSRSCNEAPQTLFQSIGGEPLHTFNEASPKTFDEASQTDDGFLKDVHKGVSGAVSRMGVVGSDKCTQTLDVTRGRIPYRFDCPSALMQFAKSLHI